MNWTYFTLSVGFLLFAGGSLGSVFRSWSADISPGRKATWLKLLVALCEVFIGLYFYLETVEFSTADLIAVECEATKLYIQ